MTSPAHSSLSDADLVAALLDATRDMSLREAAQATGIQHQQISRYRHDDWTYLTDHRRAQIRDYLARSGWGPRAELTDEERRRLLVLKARFEQAVWRADRIAAAEAVSQMREVLE